MRALISIGCVPLFQQVSLAIPQRPIGTFWRWVVVTTVLAVTACGGGGSGDEPVTATLMAELTDRGTYLECQSSRVAVLTLRRTGTNGMSAQVLDCPSSSVLVGDFALSTWEAVMQRDGIEVVLSQVDTRLPVPTVLNVQSRFVSLPLPTPIIAAIPALGLQALDSGLQPLTESDIAALQVSGRSPAFWQWVSMVDGKSFRSAAVRSIEFAENNLGFWGALAMGDSAGDSRDELLGTVAGSEVLSIVSYEQMGLAVLFANRTFRDVRFADLLNRGMQDVIANVYGSGCAMIGFRREVGGYDFITPLRSDGNCIDGHGETILVADFDGDGFVDILLPSYERFDLLRNDGNGNFAEIADALGIASPDYQPKVEGAAAVDLNLDGFVDVIIVNEIFMNDGTGRFTALPSPFGPSRVFDEGQSVADLDNDGFYDLVKHHPAQGPRIYWGRAERTAFDDAGWLFGGQDVLRNSYGLGIGRLTGHKYLDIVFSGGFGGGVPPRLCIQPEARTFQCLPQVLPTHEGATSDLVMVTDVDGNGSEELVSRYGSLRIFSGAAPPERVFRVDLRSAEGMRNQFGRSMSATCTVDGSLLSLRFVDGGNGFMAQTSYIVPFTSSWCPSIFVDVAVPSGSERFGPLLPGTHVLRTAN